MKKALSLVSSAALALAMMVPAQAAPTAKKLTAGGDKTIKEITLKTRNARDARFSVAKTRSLHKAATPSLNKAMKASRLGGKKAKAAPRAAAAAFPNMKGMVTYMDSWESSELGLYSVASDGALEPVLLFSSFSEYAQPYTGVCVDGIYYVPTYVNYAGLFNWVEINAFDVEGGEQVGSNSNGEIFNIALDYAIDPTTGDVYGINYNEEGSGMMLAKHNFTLEGSEPIDEVIPVANLAGNWNSLACDAAGQLYGISYTVANSEVVSSTLCKIDKTTGAVTEIGETGQLPVYLSSAAIDTKTGVMYWSLSTDYEGALYTVDLTTGAATFLTDLEDGAELQGMYIDAPLAEEDAPAAVENLAVEFADGGLTGTVSFTAPTTLFDGTAASGALTYSILANGDEVATGSTTFGAEVEEEVTLTESGSYTFLVTVSNAAGKSPATKLTSYVGYGVPKAPVATLVYENGEMKLTWTAVTATVDGGYINPAAVTYTVTRFPDEEVVAEDITATEFSEPIAEPTTLKQYYYTVVAKSNGLKSAAAASNIVGLGNLVPPFTNTFDTEDSLEGYTIIDSNGDSRKWNFYNSSVRISYNPYDEQDDWFVTPAIKLEAGNAYYVSTLTKAQSSTYPERIEIKIGTAATAEAMTETLVAPTVVSNTTFEEIGGYFVPETDGLYYVGVHAISDADTYYLYIDDLSVSAPMATTAPGAVTNVVITPDPNGANEATISFKAPAKDFAGNALTENLTKIEVSRDDEVVKTFTDVAPGTDLSFTDELENGGTVTYTFQAFNATGEGKTESQSVFIGVDKPAAPQNVVLTETATPGEVILTWDAVTTDKNGNTINPALVTYLVAVPATTGWTAITENPISETSYTYQAVPAGEQEFVQMAVFAVTAGGNAGTASDMIAVGTPYPYMEESFANGKLNGYILGVEVSDDYGVEWGFMTDASGIPAQDDDNGFLALSADYRNDSGAFWTGKIDLSDAVKPGVSFYTYNFDFATDENPDAVDLNTLQLYVKKAADTEWTALGEQIVISELGESDSWVPVSANLAAYAGQVIQVKVEATVVNAGYTLFDNFKVGDMLDHDLAAGAVTVPAKAKVGFDYNVVVKVANVGTQAAGAFTIKLFADGEAVATKDIESLAAAATLSETFTFTMPALATEPIEYYAEVIYADDENTANNTSKTASITPQASNLPAVTDLAAENSATGVKLTWSEPDLSDAPSDPETVDFEDGDSWAMEYGDWTFVDGDNSPVGGFQGTDIPGITANSTTASFFIFDTNDDTVVGQYADSFKGHSGSKYLASLFRADDGKVDDWAISPTLDGSAQTVTFWAKSYSSNYPETIEVYYSTTGIETTDFVKIAGVGGTLSSEWTEIEFDVPAGATHFAVRSVATGSFMLMLDDFTFATAGVGADLSLVGYDIYRDGEKITEEPVAECEYTDTEATDGEHSYVVVVVYDKGISAPSNTATIVYDGISDATAAGISISAGKGVITVAGAEGKLLTVAAADGKLYFNGTAAARQSVAAPAGIYVVKAGTKIAKVAVK